MPTTRTRDPVHPQDVRAFDSDIAAVARARHTAKAYRSGELEPAEVNALHDLLRFSASSVNSQPWHFVIGTSPEGRKRIAMAAAGKGTSEDTGKGTGKDTGEDFSFNSDNIRNCGMAVVFAARIEADDAYLDHLLEVEAAHGRFPEDDNRAEMKQIREWFVGLMRDASGDAHDWMARQVYWNGGQFLLGAAAMGLDATPMEGIDRDALDAEFDLHAKGYRSLFAVTVGRNEDAQDWNLQLPKSRLSLSEIATRI